MPARQHSSRTKAIIAQKRRDLAASASEFHVTAEERHTTPLMPRNLTSPEIFRTDWTCDTMAERFSVARRLADRNDWVGALLYIKHNYFADGFRFCDLSKKVKVWRTKAQSKGFDFIRFSGDVWTEWLACDNVVVFWREPKKGSGKLPSVVVLDCEICTYDDTLGAKSLKVKPGHKKLSDAQIRMLGPRWAKAWIEGREVELMEDQGEYFEVLSRAKVGKGMGEPRIVQVLESLSTYELLGLADWTGAWEHKDLIQHITKGHEIKNGDLAGLPKHFITKKQQAAIMKAMKVLSGGRRVVTNFDMKILWQFLNPNFFDGKKYDGTVAKLENWGGAAALLLKSGQTSPLLMDVFAAEGRSNRQKVGNFIDRILNNANFHAELPPPEEVQVGWNEQSFLNIKMMLEWIRLGCANGLVSPQTGRNAMGVENDTETALMREAHKHPEDFTPPFEAKQGMVGGSKGGGRPSDKPTTQTPPTQT